MMIDRKPKSRNNARTIAGALVGAGVAGVCWISLVLISTLDDAAHWKGTLLAAAILLPLLCTVGGVIISRGHRNGFNYVVANTGVTLLGTILSTAAAIASLSLSLSLGFALSIPVFFAFAYFEERCLSAIVNRCVERLAGTSPQSST